MAAQSITTEKLGTLLGFSFQDADWKNKYLIGSLIVLAGFAIPLIPFFFLYGYMMQIMRRIIVDKGEPYLPEWDDWGRLFIDGLKLLGVVLIYMLPVMIVFMIGFFVIFFLPFLGLPFAAIGGDENPEVAGAAFVGLSLISTVGFFIILGLGMILGLAIGLIMPAVMGHVVATDDFGAAFRIKEWWAIFRANLGGFLLASIIIILISMVLNSVLAFLYCTIILFCLAPFLVAPITLYTVVVSGAVFGLAYRDGVEKLETPAPTAETEKQE